MTKFREIKAKSILNKSNLPGISYSINPYSGCQHNCAYCYVPQFLAKFTRLETRVSKQGFNRSPSQKWGSFVNIKINSPEILKKELNKASNLSIPGLKLGRNKAKKGLVLFSSVTDPYQPIEKKYKLTRKLLKILAENQFPVSILTKSSLILRDLDILKKFNSIEAGFSLFTEKEAIKQLFEVKTSSVTSRINALKRLKQAKIPNYVFIAPTIPYLTNYENILKAVKGKVDYIMIDKFNPRGQNWLKTEKILKQNFPDILPQIRKVIRNKNYWQNKKQEAEKLGQKFKIPIKICF